MFNQVQDEDQWLSWLFGAEANVCEHENVVDHSYANSECGCIDVKCKTCGMSWQTWLY